MAASLAAHGRSFIFVFVAIALAMTSVVTENQQRWPAAACYLDSGNATMRVLWTANTSALPVVVLVIIALYVIITVPLSNLPPVVMFLVQLVHHHAMASTTLYMAMTAGIIDGSLHALVFVVVVCVRLARGIEIPPPAPPAVDADDAHASTHAAASRRRQLLLLHTTGGTLVLTVWAIVWAHVAYGDRGPFIACFCVLAGLLQLAETVSYGLADTHSPTSLPRILDLATATILVALRLKIDSP